MLAKVRFLIMKKLLSLFLILFSFTCFQVTAIESRLRLAAAQPTNKQNLDISTLELSYLIDGGTFHDNFDLQWHVAFNLGNLAVENVNIMMLGGALGLSYPIINKLDIFFEGGVTWLDQHEFGQVGIAYKDYGGPWQYQAKLGVDYNIRKSWNFGYAYLHMSNGDRYHINPSLDAHSLYVSYQF